DMVPRYPQLVQLLAQAVRTDMSAGDLLQLALAAREVPQTAIISRAIEFPAVTTFTGSDGADLLLPNRTLMRPIVNAVFSDPRLTQEAAHVEVLNGAGITGLATRTADRLRDQGFAEVTVSNATDGQTHPTTQILDLTGKPYSAGVLALA